MSPTDRWNFSEILLTAQSSAEALQDLFANLRGAQPSLSAAEFCRSAGIPSRGYWSDVLGGRRILNKKYLDSVCSILLLDPLAARTLGLLVDIDRTRARRQRLALRGELALVRKQLATKDAVLSETLTDTFLAFEVFCAFDLFRGQPTYSDLAGIFCDQSGTLTQALGMLETAALIERIDDHFQKRRDVVIFSGSSNGMSHLDFFKSSLQQVRSTDLAHWFGRPEMACMQSLLLSVRADQYSARLEKIRKTLYDEAVALQSDDADSVVHMNIQIYPTRLTPKSPTALS